MTSKEWRERMKAYVVETRELHPCRRYKLPSRKWAAFEISSTVVRGPGAAPEGDIVPLIRVEVRSVGGEVVSIAQLTSDDLARLAGLRGEFERWLSGVRNDLPTEESA